MKPDKKKEIRRVAGSLGTIRAWSDHADSDRLYAKENVDKLYTAIEQAESDLIKIILEK
jgi:hypothetical protein